MRKKIGSLIGLNHQIKLLIYFLFIGYILFHFYYISEMNASIFFNYIENIEAR